MTSVLILGIIFLLLFVTIDYTPTTSFSVGSVEQADAEPGSKVDPQWPLRFTYTITYLYEPQVGAELAEVERVFEGSGWDNWRDYEVGLTGGCKLRSGTSLMLSMDGCQSDAFGDEYDFEEGEPYGANNFVRKVPDLSELQQKARLVDPPPRVLALAETLDLSRSSLVSLVTERSVECKAVGLDCDYVGEEVTTRTVIPSVGILLAEDNRFNGDLLSRFEVTEIEFGVNDLPSQLVDS